MLNLYTIPKLDGSPYRSDITGFRAIAVLFVLGSHFFPNIFPSGYLGVDLFFVISGFVITRSLLQSKVSNMIKGLGDFYANRLRRIAPALFTVVILVLLISPLFMTKPGGELARTGGYSLIGLSNLYLFHIQTDYFGLRASQNPYTHTWSLGVEEQFYLFFPILFFTLRKFFKSAFRQILILSTLALTLCSLFLNNYFSNSSPSAAFYLLPTRIWEIAAGVLAMTLLSIKTEKLPNNKVAYFVALFLLFFILSISINSRCFSQVITVFAASMLLFLNESGSNVTFLNSRPLSWLGNCSLSVYLVHWPLLVGSNYVLGTGFIKNCAFATLSIILGRILYKYVEIPFRIGRYKANSKRTLVIGLITLFLTSSAILQYSPRFAQGYNDFFPKLMRVDNVPSWTNYRCSGWANVRQFQDPINECLGKSPKSRAKSLYLVGDSHAIQFIPMIQKSILNTSFELKYLNLERKIDFPFAEFESNHLSASLSKISRSARSGDYVFLAFHRGHLNSERDLHLDLNRAPTITSHARNLVDNLNRFAISLKGRDVKIILVSDTPLLKTDQSVQSCAMQIKLFTHSACEISKRQDLQTRKLQDFVFKSVDLANKNVFRWDPLPCIYGNSSNFDVLDSRGHYLMLDSNHISKYTALNLVSNFDDFVRLIG